ncbi:Uncharacterised protein [Legionella sainthelensi]|uniref:DUF5677 domain-containing protein n=1 Tax=Legionella sainthelensi TaxID=28087 RepID=UPI000F6BD3CF|nr:DUF5677 domain-containing protein [Legionella sainthelensi]VEB36701.1 Uncharacterised protein [Legionella sainthelensi]
MNIFEHIFELLFKELGEKVSLLDGEEIITLMIDKAMGLIAMSETEVIDSVNNVEKQFIERNYNRWKSGFNKLEMLRQISLEAGAKFQKQFLKYPEFESDPLLGVLLRHHANACRITGEIIVLLKNGYADGALARWRTLFEILITCLVIKKYGKEAAEDYIKHGVVKSVEGMEEYQKTAAEMGLEPYNKEEFKEAIKLKDFITQGENYYQWATKYAGASKLEKLREIVGMSKWSHNYKLASKHVHADYSEMKSLFAMSEAKQDLLLAGSSNSGLVEPASMTAVTFNQITATFLTAYIEKENSPLNYNISLIYLAILDKYAEAVGLEFLACERAITPET